MLFRSTALWLLGRWRRDDPVQRAWSDFCRKMARAGLQRSPSEGPLDFGQRGAQQLPQRADTIRRIVDLYIDLRYGREAPAPRARELRQLVSGFKP